jgi:hypothetical protein
VESRSLVSESKILTLGSLSGTESPEVLYGLGDSPTRSATPWKTQVAISLSIKSHDDPTHGLSSMFDIKVDLYCQIGDRTKDTLAYLVGDDRSLRCLSLLREDEENPNDEGK